MAGMGNTSRRRYINFDFPPQKARAKPPTMRQIIGANFERRREQLGLSKIYVAKELGYNRHWVRDLERGKTCFDFSQGPQVASLLKLETVEELYKAG
jgi:ribosome-binding protein aMBF1 (putative translation factor)